MVAKLTIRISIQCNSDGERGLRNGYADVVRELIDYAKKDTDVERGTRTTKEMPRMRNVEGDTALHEAVRNENNLDVVEILTTEDSEFEYLPNNVDDTPLFLAVERGKSNIVSKLLENCILSTYSGLNGRTVLHAATIYRHQGKHSRFVMPTPKEPESYRNKFKVHKKDEAPKTENNINQEITKLADTALIVAALIATITFTAGFTVPGGFESNNGVNKGMAVLARRAAFIAFAVTDTIAMVLSIIAVFLLLISSTYILNDYENENKRMQRQSFAFLLIVAAMGAMVVAFMTGFYATLEPSLGLAITICLICSVFFPISFIVFGKRFQGFF
ncbi:ankyrin repeat-containing protein At5g02620-like [Cornus florida]|uniref:ankyrin repeat-containing protein At5g02620-like n=1 Tax=Cornus florida TaxID=4283 RepID=UPI00289FD650|nr:ankyrin repeat-containing protein At5g02620-like [Cornus florida]